MPLPIARSVSSVTVCNRLRQLSRHFDARPIQRSSEPFSRQLGAAITGQHQQRSSTSAAAAGAEHSSMGRSAPRKAAQKGRAPAAPVDLDGRLDKVLNARDLSSACPELIRPGRIFRSGSPSHASLADVRLLRGDLGLRVLIDFRSSDERKEDSAWSLMLSNGIIKTYDVQGNITEVSVDHSAELHGVHLEEAELHHLSLLERNRFIWALLRRLPYSTLIWAAIYKVLGWEENLRSVVVPEINRGGLLLIYQIVLQTAGADIVRTLELVLDAAESRRAQLFFCKLGKDRTGMMAALILSCCGASEEQIIADYARSDGIDQVALGGLEKSKETQGMDSQLFARAPAEAMRATLDWIRETYGSVRGYLDSIGFGREQQKRLAAALASDEPAQSPV